MPFPDVSSTPPVRGTPTSSGDALVLVHARNFDAEVLKARGPVAVEFMSYGCPHCRVAEPFVQDVARSLAGREKMCRVNVPVEHDLAARYRIEGTPTFIMFLNGREVGRAVGPRPSFESIKTAVTAPFAQ